MTGQPFNAYIAQKCPNTEFSPILTWTLFYALITFSNGQRHFKNDCNGTRTHKHLRYKLTLNFLAKLVKFD